MSKTGSAAKVKLNSFDDLFGTEQPQTGTEQVQEIALSELHEFKGHPFKVLDDEKMQETMESIREHGVLMPGIARPMKDGGYEIIAGHRRRHACELVGLTTMPMFIRDYTDDEATIINYCKQNSLNLQFRIDLSLYFSNSFNQLFQTFYRQIRCLYWNQDTVRTGKSIYRNHAE